MAEINEIKLPKIETKTDLSRDEAVSEYRKLHNLEKPKYGWQTWLEKEIENRKVFLAKLIANDVAFTKTRET